MRETLRLIDLPPSLVGGDCAFCMLDGIQRRALFQDKYGAPACEDHFVSLVVLEARFLAIRHEEACPPFRIITATPSRGKSLLGEMCFPGAHAANRRKGGPGGRASAEKKRLRRAAL